MSRQSFVNGLLYIILLAKNIVSIMLLLRVIGVCRLHIIILPIYDGSKYLKNALLKGLRMVDRALWRSEARRVVPWSETVTSYTVTIPIVEYPINSSPPEQNCCNFADGIFRCISVNGKFIF